MGARPRLTIVTVVGACAVWVVVRVIRFTIRLAGARRGTGLRAIGACFTFARFRTAGRAEALSTA
jgi:hypothetical protein